MKNLTSLIALVLFTYLPSVAQDMKYTSTIDIMTTPAADPDKKEKEVWVTLNDDIYVIHYTIKHGKQIKTHQARVTSDKSYDKASYTWVSKKKVALRLFSSQSSDMVELMVWSTKHNNCMEIEVPDDFVLR